VTNTQNMSNQSLYSRGNHSRTTSGTEHRQLGSSPKATTASLPSKLGGHAHRQVRRSLGPGHHYVT
jgi:hypothetical protein